MLFKRFRPSPWAATLLAALAIVALSLAPRVLLPVDDRRQTDPTAMFPALKWPVTIDMDPGTFQNALASVSKQAGFDIYADWNRLAAHGVQPQTRVHLILANVQARDAIFYALQTANLLSHWLEVDDRGRIAITDRPPMFARRYEARDLWPTDPLTRAGVAADLREAIMRKEWESWEGFGGVGTIDHQDGQFLIKQSMLKHFGVQEFLRDKRNRNELTLHRLP